MLRGKSLSKEILFIAVAGPVVLSSLFLPNAAIMLKPLIKWRKNWNRVSKYRLYEAVNRLNKKRLVELVEKNGKLYIEITKNGKKLVKKFDYDNLELPRSKVWDKKWRLVVFDIPDKKRKERQAFSKKLKDIGFYPMQESVFIYPYDCRNEIDFICEFLSIGRYVNYCLIESLDKKEGDLYRFFNFKI